MANFTKTKKRKTKNYYIHTKNMNKDKLSIGAKLLTNKGKNEIEKQTKIMSIRQK